MIRLVLIVVLSAFVGLLVWINSHLREELWATSQALQESGEAAARAGELATAAVDRSERAVRTLVECQQDLDSVEARWQEAIHARAPRCLSAQVAHARFGGD